MAADYQTALDHYDRAKADLRATETVTDVAAVDRLLEEGRFHLARVLALRDGVEPPTRRDPCFFNPQHGPAVADVPWKPPGGVERLVPVCRRDRERLEGGEEPDVRLVRVGDRYVPAYQVGDMSALVHHHQAMAHEPSMSHHRYNQLQADIDRIGGSSTGI